MCKETETRRNETQTTEATVIQPLVHSNFIIVKIKKKRVKCLVDTGSITSIINLKLAKELKLRLEPVPQGESKVLFLASTTAMPIVAVAEVKMKFSELYIYHTVKVVDNISHDLILGTDLMCQNAAIIDYRSGLISICDNSAALPLQSNVIDKYIVQNMQEVCIPKLVKSFQSNSVYKLPAYFALCIYLSRLIVNR